MIVIIMTIYIYIEREIKHKQGAPGSRRSSIIIISINSVVIALIALVLIVIVSILLVVLVLIVIELIVLVVLSQSC